MAPAVAVSEFFDRYPQMDINIGVTNGAVNPVEDSVDCGQHAGLLRASGVIGRPIDKRRPSMSPVRSVWRAMARPSQVFAEWLEALLKQEGLHALRSNADRTAHGVRLSPGNDDHWFL